MNLKELPMAFKYLEFHVVNTWSHISEKLQTFGIPMQTLACIKTNVLKVKQFKAVILVLYPVMVINVNSQYDFSE